MNRRRRATGFTLLEVQVALGILAVVATTVLGGLLYLAHGTLQNDNPQAWYGLFVAGLLDWDNNPLIFPVTMLRANLPPELEGFTGSAFGVVVFRWRGVF